MNNELKKIQKWESVEVERSASEAKKRKSNDLRLDESILERYANPPANTPYYLEYSYHVLGDVKNKIVLDYGCGMGENTVLVANRGAKVVGVDISPELIELAEKRLKAHNWGGGRNFA